MEKADVIAIIQNAVPDADIALEGEDCNFTVRVISPSFASMRTLQRQQTVLAGFNEQLRSGEIHALSVKAMTPEEWQKSQQLASIEGLGS